MKHEIIIRITVTDPVAGVSMQVQRGRDELLPPSGSSDSAVSFDFSVTVDLSGPVPNFLGKYAQGPKNQRFIYVNSGTYAGQHSCWGRRAKISLMSITREQIEEVLAEPGARLEAEIAGTAKDGGPMCASVPVIGGWRVVLFS
jgi:hypothetical protein